MYFDNVSGPNAFVNCSNMIFLVISSKYGSLVSGPKLQITVLQIDSYKYAISTYTFRLMLFFDGGLKILFDSV